jgi:hypothetical protein
MKEEHNFTFPILGRSFDFARLFRICDTAPQHFNEFATSSSLKIYSSSVNGNDLYNSKKYGTLHTEILLHR